MKDELNNLPDQKLAEVFAAEVAEIKEPQWLIMKGGYYFRPLARGYTSQLAEAGRFTEEYARDYERTSHGDCRAERDAIPPFTTSADAVLPFLERLGLFPEIMRPWHNMLSPGPEDEAKRVWEVRFDTVWSISPTFARALCIALIRYVRATKGQA
jgi:hypothetical protein